MNTHKMVDTDVIKSSVRIEDLLQVPVESQGSVKKCNCVFHDHSDKDASFMVYEDTNTFYCFGCKRGGDVINFVELYYDLTFKDAVNYLIDEFNLQVSDIDRSINDYIYNINKLSMEYFNKQLLQDSKPLEYVTHRGISKESIDLFKLGYCNASKDLYYSLYRDKHMDTNGLDKSNLFSYDKSCVFKNRIVFPIFNDYHRCVGFGGRILDGFKGAKYYNSSDSSVFTKGHFLYGLNISKTNIKSQNKAIIVEGYIDVISLYQQGICNVAGVLGTSLTSEHIKLLNKYTDKIVLLYDGDNAGRIASIKSIDKILPTNLSVDVVILPEGYDPHDYITQYGKDGLLNYIDNYHEDGLEYRLKSLFHDLDKKKPGDKKVILARCKSYLNSLHSKIMYEVGLKWVYNHLGMDRVMHIDPASDKQYVAVNVEYKALSLIIHNICNKDIQELVNVLDENLFNIPDSKRVIQELKSKDITSLELALESIDDEFYITRLSQYKYENLDEVYGCLSVLKKSLLQKLLKDTQNKIATASDSITKNKFLKEFINITKEFKRFSNIKIISY